MAGSFLLIGAVVTSLLCTKITDGNSSNDDVHYVVNLLPVKDVVIETVFDYLKEQGKRLATLRNHKCAAVNAGKYTLTHRESTYSTLCTCQMNLESEELCEVTCYLETSHIEDYSKEHGGAIRKVARALNTATKESFVNGDEEMQKQADESDVFRLLNYTNTNYEKLCNGEILLQADIQKKLKCRYVNRGTPFLKIAPFKEEEVYLDPRIIIYHDVIHEKEIETLKRISNTRLETAKTRNVTTGENETSKHRNAKSAWLFDEENTHVKLLSRRVEHMTGLTVKTAEPLQIAYYGIGGYYVPHFDFFQKLHRSEYKNGNRIATVLFYMNDVARGGGTAFTRLNFTVRPEKGSAVFWYNLKRNGEGNELLTHGACPVLSGTKWIATKWLQTVGQEFIRPCTLLENE